MDQITIDQLRAFVTVVDTGSFTAASKRLHRVQSAVSYAISSLENELSLQLFDRSTRTPTLTPNGESLLVEAREILRRTEVLKLHAKDISKGIEATLSVVVDSLFPIPALVEICKAYAARFPRIPLSLHMESLGAAIELLEKNVCDFGIVGPYASSAQALSQESLGSSPLKTVVSPKHPLASWKGTIPNSELEQHNQIVVTDRSALTSGTSFGVLSNQIWKVSDLHSKYALIKGDLGWGNLPLYLIEADLKRGTLVEIIPDVWKHAPWSVTMYAAHRKDKAIGPAAEWFIKEAGNKLQSSS